MSAPLKPWETSNALGNTGQIHRNSQLPMQPSLRSAPVLPPRPQRMMNGNIGTPYTSPYSLYGNSYNYGSQNTMGWPGRSMYGYDSFGSFGNSYGMYGSGYGMRMGIRDDAESRFIQFAEDSSRSAFANVESVVRAFNGIAMMLDNTFFAMTSSFRAVLGVAENFGRLRTMFAHIWQAVNVFRLFTWLHRKLLTFLGVKPTRSTNSLAWTQALNGYAPETARNGDGSSWPTIAFFGVLFSVPYFISKLLPKYEDKCDPEKWKYNGIPAKAAFDFPATSANELTLHTNDEILLAPKSVQDEMRLSNSGWAYAACNGHSGVIPLNYIVIMKKAPNSAPIAPIIKTPPKKVQKRVSFGETQIFEPPNDMSQSEITAPLIDCSSTNNTTSENEIQALETNETTKGIRIEKERNDEQDIPVLVPQQQNNIDVVVNGPTKGILVGSKGRKLVEQQLVEPKHEEDSKAVNNEGITQSVDTHHE